MLNTTGIYEWRVYGSLWTTYIAGVSCLLGIDALYNKSWDFATTTAFYMHTNIINIHEWVAYGYLRIGVGHAGVSCMYGYPALSGLLWYFATTMLSL